MANLTSSLTLSLKDLLSKPAGEAAAALKKFGLSAQDMQKSIKLDSFRQLQQSFAKARAEVAATQQKMKELAAQFEKKPSNNLETALKRAADSAVRAKDAFTQQSRAIIESKNSLQSLGIPLSQVATEQARLKRGTLAATEALEQQGAKAQTLGARVRRGIGGVVGAIATVAGPAVLGATVKAVEAGMELDSAETRQRKAGISEDEMKQAKAIILHQKTLWPGLSLSGMDDVYIKERSITNSPKEAQQMLPIFAKAMSALGDDAAGMGLMVKAAQTLGAALDPGRFARFMDAYIKAKSVHSDLLSPEEMLSFFRGLKASGALLSDRFLHSTGMSLAAEMKGKQGGGGLNELIQTFVNPTSAEARAFQKIGLMSKDDFKPPTPHGGFGKGFGHVSGEKEGKVKSGAHAHVAGAGPNDWKLWETDPDLAMNKYLLPALIAQGITKQDEQIEWAQANLKPGAAAVFTNLLTKDEEHKADAERMFAAPGFEAAEINAKDATIQLKGLRQELWDTLAVMTSPAMLQAATTMHSISKSIAEWSEWINAWQEKHPTAAPYASAGGIAGGLAAGGAAGLLLAVKALRFIKGLSGGVAAGEAAAAPGAGGGLTGWAAGLGIPAAAAYAGTHLTPAEQAIQDEMQRRQSAGEPEPTHGTFNSWDEILRRIKEELPGGGGMGTGYRIPAPTGSPFSPQAPFFQLPSIDTRSADAEAAGERFGAAFRQGVATGLNGAYFDTHSTIDKIIAMMTFGASPSIKPTGGDIWTSGTTGITANGIFSDSGVAPMR